MKGVVLLKKTMNLRSEQGPCIPRYRHSGAVCPEWAISIQELGRLATEIQISRQAVLETKSLEHKKMHEKNITTSLQLLNEVLRNIEAVGNA